METRKNRAPVWGVWEAGEERAGSGRNHATMLNNLYSKKGLGSKPRKMGWEPGMQGKGDA